MSKLSAASGEDLRLGYQNTGSSVGGGSYTGGSVQQRLNRLSKNGLLQPPGTGGDGPKSASFIAATLAASRSPSLSPNPTGQQVEARKTFSRSPSVKSGSSSDLVDATPAPPMKGLIGLFEENSGERKMLPLKRSDTTATVKRIPREPSQISLQPRTPSPPRNEPRKVPKPEIRSPKPNLSRPKSEYLPNQTSTLGGPTKSKPSVPSSKPIPIPPNPKSPHPAKTLPSPGDASSDDSFVSASSQHTEPNYLEQQPSFRATLAQKRHLNSPSATSLPSTTATIDSMANAIVASSLASSRAASPSKLLANFNKYPPVPPARKTGRNHHIFHHSPSRTPSPAKQVGMRTTLRKVKSKDSIDEGEKRRAKKSLVKKHPHKHHEGDRKRWRDSITERERKRYEAVWASNRGSWLGDEESDRVCSLLVRDIWSRSRLNADILEEVYALVDRTGRGSLEREEFVVGMWLIDQWLRGRKLPMRVSESVWKSVGSTGGIKINGPKVKK